MQSNIIKRRIGQCLGRSYPERKESDRQQHADLVSTKDQQERIFERFYRVDKSHSKETGGTGLGLSIVKHGAIMHNAQIHVESEEGKGTKMEITF